MRRRGEGTESVSTVVGVVLMVAIAVILAAFVGAFGQEFTKNLDESVNAGVDIKFDQGRDRVEVVFVSNQNAGYIKVRFEGGWDNGTAGKIRLNETGSRGVLNTSKLSVSGNAIVIQQPGEFPGNGDDVTVTAVAYKQGETSSTPVEYKTGEI